MFAFHLWFLFLFHCCADIDTVEYIVTAKVRSLVAGGWILRGLNRAVAEGFGDSFSLGWTCSLV